MADSEGFHSLPKRPNHMARAVLRMWCKIGKPKAKVLPLLARDTRHEHCKQMPTRWHRIHWRCTERVRQASAGLLLASAGGDLRNVPRVPCLRRANHILSLAQGGMKTPSLRGQSRARAALSSGISGHRMPRSCCA